MGSRAKNFSHFRQDWYMISVVFSFLFSFSLSGETAMLMQNSVASFFVDLLFHTRHSLVPVNILKVYLYSF